MEDSSLTIVTQPGPDESRGDRLRLVNRTVGVDQLRERFDDFMAKLQTIVRAEAAETDTFQLAEVQFAAEISAEGEFKLMGTGVGVAASSCVTFVLQRRPDQPAG